MKQNLKDTPAKRSKLLVKHLQDAMKQQQVTLYALHKATGIPKMTVYNLFKTGSLHRDIEQLITICQALNIEITFTTATNEK